MINQQGKVKFVKGSILMPQMAGLRFILNFASMAGSADGPLNDLFAKKWAKVRQDIKGWYGNKNGAYKLGAISQTAVQSDAVVVHLLVEDEKGKVDKKGLELGLKELEKLATYEHASIHISTYLLDKFPKLKEVVEKELVQKGLSVSYYEEV